MIEKPGFSWSRFLRRPEKSRVFIAGIVNVTPDSFSDSRGIIDVPERIDFALKLLDEGADLIDLGGESTRPGAMEVPSDEEWQRIAPVISGILSACPEAVLSIDTRHADTARQALQAGALIINDVSGMQFDPAMAGVISGSRAGVILTHSTAIPEIMQQQGVAIADNVLEIVQRELQKMIASANGAGISGEQLMLDVGIGFGKTRAANYELLRHAGELEKTFNLPFCWGVSRKSMFKSTPDTLEKRIAASLAAAINLSAQGVSLLRVHDVSATIAALNTAAELTGVK